MKIYLCVDPPHFDGEHNSQTEAVFTSKKNAKRFCKVTGFEMREIDMDHFEKAMSLNYKLFDVTVEKEGVVSCIKADINYMSASDIDLCKFNWDNSAFKLKCFAKDEQHATEIATAKRDQMLEENLWPAKPVGKRAPRMMGDIPLGNDLLNIGIFDPYKRLRSPILNFAQLME